MAVRARARWIGLIQCFPTAKLVLILPNNKVLRRSIFWLLAVPVGSSIES